MVNANQHLAGFVFITLLECIALDFHKVKVAKTQTIIGKIIKLCVITLY